MDWVTSELHSVERWRSEPRRHRRYTAGRRSKSGRQGRGDRHANCYADLLFDTLRYSGIAELCESAIRFLWYMTGSTRFSTAPGASGFSDRPVIARPRNYKLYVIHDAEHGSCSLSLCECKNNLFNLFFLWFFSRNEVRVKIGKNNRCAVFRMERKGANGFGYDTTDRSWYGWRRKYFSTACCRYHHR